MNEQRRPDSALNVSAPSEFPRHVAVIMDGNGRWARQRGLPRIAGHRKGLERVRELVSACNKAGISYLTLFAFSSENWRRPPQEVRLLMDLFLNALGREIDKLHQNGVRFQVIGDTRQLRKEIQQKITQAEEMTRNNAALVLTIAANYGGRWDIAQACAKLAERVHAGEVKPEEIGPDTLEPFLTTHGLPEPDLFIRSGGEQRISNFLLWQLAYTELYFTPVLWPDFDDIQFSAALDSYAGRQRRFGRTGEQIDAAYRA